jgi:hypothetical protein
MKSPMVIFLAMLLLYLPSCRFIKQKLGLGEYSLKSARDWAEQDSTRIADSLKRVIPDKKVIKSTLTDSMEKVMLKKNYLKEHRLIHS